MDRRMDEVELVEVTADGAAPAEPHEDPRAAARRARARRALRRWWPVPAVLVAVLVGAQVVRGAQEDARTERLREVDGVLPTTLSPPFEITRWGDPEAWMLGPGSIRTQDGTYIGLDQAQPGAQWSVIAADVRTGTVSWSVPLGEVPELGGSGLSCVGEQEPVLAVWCQVTSTPAGAEGEAVSRLTRVDVRTREVTASGLHAGEQQIAAGDGVLVVATVEDDRAVLRATRGADGSPAWTASLPAVDGALPWMVARDGYLITQTSAGSARAFDLADGRVVADGGWLGPLRDGTLFDSDGDDVTRLLGPDGDGSVTVEGIPVTPLLDDGSVPDVVVVHREDDAGGGVLRGVDGTTGDVRWEQPDLLRRGEPVLVLDGALVGGTTTSMWSLDLADGAIRWRTEAGDAAADLGLVTDGVAVLRVEQPDREAGAEPAGTELAAYRLTDGVRLWAEPLSGGVTWVQSDAGLLFGYGDAGRVTLG